MKPETEKAIRGMDALKRMELLELLFEISTPQEWQLAMCSHDAPRELSDKGGQIYNQLLVDHGSDLIDPDEPEFKADCERLHEAICEGRAQDALDLLADITGGEFRDVKAQNFLFPDRVIGLEF